MADHPGTTTTGPSRQEGARQGPRVSTAIDEAVAEALEPATTGDAPKATTKAAAKKKATTKKAAAKKAAPAKKKAAAKKATAKKTTPRRPPPRRLRPRRQPPKRPQPRRLTPRAKVPATKKARSGEEGDTGQESRRHDCWTEASPRQLAGSVGTEAIGCHAPPAVNEPLAFINFAAAFPLGSTIEGEVMSFTSHGAMVDVELPDGSYLHCYIPLSAMGTPPPTKAREVLNKGEVRPFVPGRPRPAPARGRTGLATSPRPRSGVVSAKKAPKKLA